MSSKHEWARMTWVEIKEALVEDPVILIPLGSVEQHGPHTPVGDYLATEVVAQRVAERTSALYVPTVPYGYSETHRGFPGTLTYRPATLLATLEDLTDSLMEVGAERLLFLCGHGGNVPIIEHHARDLLRTRGLRTACIDLWRLLTPGFNRSLYGQEAPLVGHGSEPIGSVMAYVAPGSTRPDLVAPPSRAAFAGLPAQGSQVVLEAVSFHVYPRSVDTSPIGVIGDPSLSSPEHGEAIIAHVVDICCKVVQWFAQLDTEVDT
ncbi:MAG: creatininase family protein [Bacillota bacterium]|nr:creatininase family protein [Bacillota bacterium]